MVLDSPVGFWQVLTSDSQLLRIHYLGEDKQATRDPKTPLEKTFVSLWQQYFSGKLVDWSTISIDIDSLKGTAFQKAVWKGLDSIPRGKTVTYKMLSEGAGSPKAFRACGQAVGNNPLPLVLPCHRVLGSDGSLCGFMLGRGKGLDIKRYLLDLEGVAYSR